MIIELIEESVLYHCASFPDNLERALEIFKQLKADPDLKGYIISLVSFHYESPTGLEYEEYQVRVSRSISSQFKQVP